MELALWSKKSNTVAKKLKAAQKKLEKEENLENVEVQKLMTEAADLVKDMRDEKKHFWTWDQFHHCGEDGEKRRRDFRYKVVEKKGKKEYTLLSRFTGVTQWTPLVCCSEAAIENVTKA